MIDTTGTFLTAQHATLTADQAVLTQQLSTFIAAHQADEQAAVFVLTGDAGSGKSVVLARVFTQFMQQQRQQQSGLVANLLVNHNEMLKVYKALAEGVPGVLKKDFSKPTPFINAMHRCGARADVVFVDEAHLLLSQPDSFNGFRQENQLDELLALTHVLILVFDPQQVVKLKSQWTTATLHQHLRGHVTEWKTLNGQLRMQDPAVSAWINTLMTGRLAPLPRPDNFAFKVFADGQPLYDWIKQRDRQLGAARLIATSDFPYRVFGAKTWYVQAGTLRLPWDKINFTDRPWASRPETLHEVGSIYTIQGFDLTTAGVIIGPSVDYDPATDRLVVDPARSEDQEAFRQRVGQPATAAAKATLIYSTLNILLKRGRAGLGIYATQPNLRRRLLALAN